MSSDPDTRREATVELKERAQAAGSALREMLGKDVDSMQQDKGRVAFDPDDYADILGGVMQKFAEVSVQTPRRGEEICLSERRNSHHDIQKAIYIGGKGSLSFDLLRLRKEDWGRSLKVVGCLLLQRVDTRVPAVRLVSETNSTWKRVTSV